MHSSAEPPAHFNPTSTRRLLTRLAVLALTLALALSLAACGEKDESTAGKKLKRNRITLLLDWFPNANHAGIYTGIETGTFERQGIDIDPQVPSDPAAVIKQVAAGRADLGISYQNEVIEARDAGVKIQAIGTIVDRPLNSLMWLKSSDVKQISDLKGKKIGTSGAYASTFLNVILKQAGLQPDDVKEVNVGYDLAPNLVAKNVDAIIGAYFNVEGVELKMKGKPATITPVDEAGAPAYNELVVIANETNLQDTGRRETYRRTLAGLRDGTSAAIASPQVAGDSLVKNYEDLGKDRDSLDESLQVTLPLLKSTEAAEPYGWMDPQIWLEFGNFMRDQGLLKKAPEPLKAYTNDLLPGQGPKE